MEWAENTRNTAPDHRVEPLTGRGPGRVTEARLTGSDQDVVRACLAGDADAYATIVERYGSRAYNIALRITGDTDAANDCAQEAFIRAYRALHQYDPALPFGPWLYRITTNASLNYIRRWHAHESPVEELPESPEDLDEGPEATALRREELGEVVAAMAELPSAYRAALTLRHMQQLSYQEVADALEIPLGTVKTHLHRARAALKVRLAARSKGRSA
jgi:RNA polymerase sigma-70 factor, ECF subfamily